MIHPLMHGVGVSWPVGTEEVQEATAARAANSAYPARTRACSTADDGLSHSQFSLLPSSRRLEPTEILTDLVAPLKPRQPRPPKSHSRRLLRLASPVDPFFHSSRCTATTNTPTRRSAYGLALAARRLPTKDAAPPPPAWESGMLWKILCQVHGM